MTECATLWTPEAVKDVIGFASWFICGILFCWFLVIPFPCASIFE